MPCEILPETKSTINETINRKALKASMEVGASSWLTTLLIKKHGFFLDKQSFLGSL